MFVEASTKTMTSWPTRDGDPSLIDGDDGMAETTPKFVRCSRDDLLPAALTGAVAHVATQTAPPVEELLHRVTPYASVTVAARCALSQPAEVSPNNRRGQRWAISRIAGSSAMHSATAAIQLVMA
jgi:hypothetical protein